MQTKTFSFGDSSVAYYFDSNFAHLKKLVDVKNSVIITDENIFSFHSAKFNGWNSIVIKAGEEYKVQATVDSIIEQLIQLQADRNTMLIGVGGGVVTDLCGYVASVFMRGINFGFVPTTLLAMVDASIGGKNGIDVGVYKNMVGVIRQPAFLLYDTSFLKTLPVNEWQNGFAEIIKHAAIKDATMFRQLEQGSVDFYRSKKAALSDLTKRNALLKTKIVQGDQFEKGDRKLLNFGHTLGHALENQYELSHGEAISIGMAYASAFSESIVGFKHTERVARLLEQYGLPTFAEFDKNKAMSVLKMDKKKTKDAVNYILLERIGKAVIVEIPFEILSELL